jgi:hypothetical protein
MRNTTDVIGGKPIAYIASYINKKKVIAVFENGFGG